MRKIVIILTSTFLLSSCADVLDAPADDESITLASENCRAAVADQLSRERGGLTMSSDAMKVAFDQRYRFCMTEKGYTVASAP